eukprot:3796133-Rhodomonas_salina.1
MRRPPGDADSLEISQPVNPCHQHPTLHRECGGRCGAGHIESTSQPRVAKLANGSCRRQPSVSARRAQRTRSESGDATCCEHRHGELVEL